MSFALIKAAVLLLNTLFGLYIFILLIRFLATLKSPLSTYNPFSRLISTLTDLPLSFLHLYVPMSRHFDLGAVVLLYALELLKQFLLLLIHTSDAYSYISIYAHLFIWPITTLLNLTLAIYFWGIILFVIFSWLLLFNLIHLNSDNPLYVFISNLVKPIITPFQRFIPPISGLDITPLVALLAIEIARFFIQLLPAPSY